MIHSHYNNIEIMKDCLFTIEKLHLSSISHLLYLYLVQLLSEHLSDFVESF